jgi:hypothetical protein
MDVKITANDNVAVYFGIYQNLPLKVVRWKTFIVEPAKLLNKFPFKFTKKYLSFLTFFLYL